MLITAAQVHCGGRNSRSMATALREGQTVTKGFSVTSNQQHRPRTPSTLNMARNNAYTDVHFNFYS